MTGRERLHNIINALPVDRIAWTTLVDDKTLSGMPTHVREISSLEFYRSIGCDIVQFGNYGLPAELRVPSPCHLVTPGVTTEESTDPGGLLVRERRTPWGLLKATFKQGHPVKHPVESLEELHILKNIWSRSTYEETSGMEEAYARAVQEIGQDGIYVPTVKPSPVQELLEYEMGPANFYYLLRDHQQDVEDLLAAMHACRLQEYEILARRTLAEVVIPVENTSSSLISPAVYRKYSLPQLKDFVRVAHRHKKKAVLHMCGLLKNLLPVIRETGLDGINALTPPPFGDVRFEEVLDVFGDGFLILGGTFDASVFQKPQVTTEEIWSALDAVYTPLLRKANFVLCLPADGQPIALEPFLSVRDWVEARGRI